MNAPNNNRRYRSVSWQISASILLTILLLVISCLLAIKFWQASKDGDVYVLIVTFAIFNVLETFLSLWLILEKETLHFNNRLAIRALIYYLKTKDVLEGDWLQDEAEFMKDRIEG